MWISQTIVDAIEMSKTFLKTKKFLTQALEKPIIKVSKSAIHIDDKNGGYKSQIKKANPKTEINNTSSCEVRHMNYQIERVSTNKPNSASFDRQRETDIVENPELDLPKNPACLIPENYFDAVKTEANTEDEDSSTPGKKRLVFLIETWDGRCVFSSTTED
jgi:hypothetical protein